MQTRVSQLAAPIALGAASAATAIALGVPTPTALLVGLVAGLAAWRPAAAPSPPSPPPAPERHGPGLELGTMMTVPSQAALLVPGQPFWLGLDELERHALVIGATGTGKTTTLGRLMSAALEADWSVLVVDAKGGRLVDVCRSLGDAHA